MIKRSLGLFLVAATLGACQLIDRQVPSKDELLEKELQSINWEEVDEWPSVPDCDSVSEKQARKQCFLDFLAQTIGSRIEADTLAVLYPELDTISVKVMINPDSTVVFQPITDADLYSGQRIDSIIKSRLYDFPKVNPALKRGLPVRTQFDLPVILNVERIKGKRKPRA